MYTHTIRHSVPGKHPWVLKHNSQFWPAWALTGSINCICLYRSCYMDPLKCGTWALTREWALARDTTAHTCWYVSFPKISCKTVFVPSMFRIIHVHMASHKATRTCFNTLLVCLSSISSIDTITSEGNIPVRKLYTEGHRMFIAPPPCTNAIAASCPR